MNNNVQARYKPWDIEISPRQWDKHLCAPLCCRDLPLAEAFGFLYTRDKNLECSFNTKSVQNGTKNGPNYYWGFYRACARLNVRLMCRPCGVSMYSICDRVMIPTKVLDTVIPTGRHLNCIPLSHSLYLEYEKRKEKAPFTFIALTFS